MQTAFELLATAQALPQRVVANDELGTFLTTDDAWIQARTGIAQRRVVTTETTTSLAVTVGETLLERSGLVATDLDFILVATMTPDRQMPSVAAQVQSALGANQAVAYDINTACAGLVVAWHTANGLLKNGARCGLVIGAEAMSQIVDWTDRRTAILFGDGAGGLCLRATPDQTKGCLSAVMQTHGAQGAALTAGGYQQATPFQPLNLAPQARLLQMDGRAIYDFVVQAVPQAIEATAAQAGVSLDQIDWFVCHQANARLLERVADRLQQPREKFPMNIATVANTSAASIGILLDELVTDQRIKQGQTIMVVGFGGGLTLGSMCFRT